MASFICFFQILENWKLSKFIFQFLEKYFSNFRIFGKMIFQKLENKLETFQFSKFWKKQMNDATIYIILLIVRETFRLNEGSGVEIGKLNLQSQPGLESPQR